MESQSSRKAHKYLFSYSLLTPNSETGRFIIMFKRAYHCSIFWDKLLRDSFILLIFSGYILVLYRIIVLSMPTCFKIFFPLDISTKDWYAIFKNQNWKVNVEEDHENSMKNEESGEECKNRNKKLRKEYERIFT